MIPSIITVHHVLAAIVEIVIPPGIPARRAATRYQLVYQGHPYPLKKDVSVAAKYAIGRELRSNEFNGGNETSTFLQGLGFQIDSPCLFARSQAATECSHSDEETGREPWRTLSGMQIAHA